ncbi:MAG: hypothetical protein ACRCYO_01410 [Bacteroidia bacterium]
MAKTGASQKALSLEDLFSLTDGHLIGLWRFRERNKKPIWCATYTIDGFYYDISGKKTPDEALKGVLKQIRSAKKKTVAARRKK